MAINSVHMHESSEGSSSTTNPKPKGSHPSACSGTPKGRATYTNRCLYINSVHMHESSSSTIQPILNLREAIPVPAQARLKAEQMLVHDTYKPRLLDSLVASRSGTLHGVTFLSYFYYFPTAT